MPYGTGPQDGSSHTEMHSLHFSIVEGSIDTSSMFFLQSMVYSNNSIPIMLTNRVL